MAVEQRSSPFSHLSGLSAGTLVGVLAASLSAVIGFLILNQPLPLVIIVALLPWVPLVLFESLSHMRQYGWIALLAVFTILNLANLTQNMIEALAAQASGGVYFCPPPIDDAANAQRAIDAGLRATDSAPTGNTAAAFIVPDADGVRLLNANGEQAVGTFCSGVAQGIAQRPPLLFEAFMFGVGIGIILAARRMRWLWAALAILAVPAVEFAITLFVLPTSQIPYFPIARQLWATIAEGTTVTAYPVGLETVTLTLYQAVGQNGVLARDGLLGVLMPSLNAALPLRVYLNLFLSALVVVITVIGFLSVLRITHARYLRRALPQLDPAQLRQFTDLLDVEHHRAGDVIVQQGDPADGFYIISKGQVEVSKTYEDGERVVLATLHAGKYFGEVGLVKGTKRTATVRAISDVELLKLDQDEFVDLVEDSHMSREQIDLLINQRLQVVYEHYVSQALPLLNAEELDRVMSQVEGEAFSPGQVIVRQGDAADDFYIITSGEVDIVDENKGGLVVDSLHAGQYFGEIALRRNTTRTATVRAKTMVEVLKLDRCEFDDLVANSELSRDEIDQRIQQRVSQFIKHQPSA
ncbi:MAG: cyclic nucleotide-binding domain-containing protein [bacterium]|nr:cyclic nucleotide-binding domain-containing protein [bacterium]